LTAEHGFSKKHPPQRQAINAPGELTIDADFDRVRDAQFVQPGVGRLHFSGDPGFRLVPSRGCAGFDDLRKSLVSRHGKPPLVVAAPQTARNVNIVGNDHAARRGRPPQDGLALGVPGKNTQPVRVDQTGR